MELDCRNKLADVFESLRFDKNHHLGMGDIRLTVDMQDIISNMFDKYTNGEARKKFWQETSALIDAYRKEGDERKAQGIVDCRILFNRLFS